MTSLVANNISVTIDGRAIVNDVSLSISTGEWLCIVGPNGAGKSTLLRALAGLAEPSGTLEIDEHDVREFSIRDRACWIAYVAQDPVAPSGMSVFEYVLLGRTAHLSLLANETQLDHDMANFVLAELDLTQFATRYVSTLSGGERQRVAIARALVQASPIILLDEPTSALDIGYSQEVLDLLDRLRREQKIAVISTMHDLTIAGQYPDRILMLANGSTVIHGTAREVLTEEHISKTYGAAVRVINDEHGPIVVPKRQP